MPATAGTDDLDDGVEEVIFDDPKGAQAVLVGVLDDETSGALVNVPGLHTAGDFFPIAPGKEYLFKHGVIGIKRITAKGDGGSTTVYFGVVAKV